MGSPLLNISKNWLIQSIYRWGRIKYGQLLQLHSLQRCRQDLENYIAKLPVETSHQRVERQSPKCAFGLLSVCCRLCANGLLLYYAWGSSGNLRRICRWYGSKKISKDHSWDRSAESETDSLGKGEIKGMDALNCLCEMLDIPKSNPHTEAADCERWWEGFRPYTGAGNYR